MKLRKSNTFFSVFASLFIMGSVGAFLGLENLKTADNRVDIRNIAPMQRILGSSDKITFEAEDAGIVGTAYPDSNPAGSGTFVEEGKTSTNPDHPTSGNKSVGYWTVAGNKIIYSLKCEEAYEGVSMTWWIANCEDSATVLDGSLKLTLNNTEVKFTSGYTLPKKGSGWDPNWQPCEIEEAVNLKKGLNIIALENVTPANVNVDCMDLYVPVGAQVELVDMDETKPTITNFQTSKDPKVGKEVTFTYDIEDNLSLREDLKVELSLVYGFGTEDAKRVDVVDNKFTPADSGEYRLTIKVTDETGNLASETFTFEVGGASRNNQKISVWTPQDSAWLVFGICVGLSVILGGVAAFLMIKKNKKA